MLIRSTFFALAFGLALAAPAVAQTSASARATLVVGELMTLRVLSTGAVPASAAGASVDAVHPSSSPVLVEVAANRAWQLNAVLDAADGRSWSAGAVARGGAGRTPVRLDYERLLESAGAAAGATLRLTLSAL